MTGMECLKEEMRKRGATTQQCESKMLPMIVDILTNANGKLYEASEMEREAIKRSIEANKDAEEKRIRAARICNDIKELETILADNQNQFDAIIKKAEEKIDKYCKGQAEYIDKFFYALDHCETDAGRDAIKAAQIFINSVEVNTKYDNTAYIIGLASILSSGAMSAIKELHKINKKMPSFEIKEKDSVLLPLAFVQTKDGWKRGSEGDYIEFSIGDKKMVLICKKSDDDKYQYDDDDTVPYGTEFFPY